MQFNINHERIILLYIIENPEYINDIKSTFFENKELSLIIKLMKAYYAKYEKIPNWQLVKVLISNAKTAGKTDIELLDDSELEDLWDKTHLTEVGEDWAKDLTEAFIKWKTYINSLTEVLEKTKLSDVDIDNVDNFINKSVSKIEEVEKVNFDRDLGTDFWNPEEHIFVGTSEYKIPSQWDFFNRATKGGFDSKSIVIYMGQTNVGKCCVYDTLINIRNKKTHESKRVKIGDFFHGIV